MNKKCLQCVKNDICLFAADRDNNNCKSFVDKDGQALPCKIGDKVWAIRQIGGVWHKRQTKVSQMYYSGVEMNLVIVVPNFTQGLWGDKIFATEHDADIAINEKEGRLC